MITKKIYMRLCITLIFFCCSFPLIAQNTLIKYYYPAYGHNTDNIGQLQFTMDSTNRGYDPGKWDVDTVVCYVIQHHQDSTRNYQLDTIFNEALSVIKNMRMNLVLIKQYADATDTNNIAGRKKNLVSIGTELFDPADLSRFSALTISFYSNMKKKKINGRYYSIASYKQIQINGNAWNRNTRFSIAPTGNLANQINDARSVLVHELMHFIGFGSSHDASPESTMSDTQWINKFKPFDPSFFQLDAIYARALYPKILPRRPFDATTRDLNNAPR